MAAIPCLSTRGQAPPPPGADNGASQLGSMLLSSETSHIQMAATYIARQRPTLPYAQPHHAATWRKVRSAQEGASQLHHLCPSQTPPPFPVLKSDWSRDRPSLSPEDSRTSPLMSVSLCWSPQIPTFTRLRSVALYGGACYQPDHVTGTVNGHLRKPGREPMDYSQRELLSLRVS